MPKSPPIFAQIAYMAVTCGPGMLTFEESERRITSWMETASLDDLDALFDLIQISASLENYEGEYYNEVTARLLYLWRRKAPDEVVARLPRITTPPVTNRSLVICVLEALQRPECFPYLAEVAQDINSLSDDDALTLVWGLAYSTAPESVSVLEQIQSQINPRLESAIEDLPSCIIVARERSSPSWAPKTPN